MNNSIEAPASEMGDHLGDPATSPRVRFGHLLGLADTDAFWVAVVMVLGCVVVLLRCPAVIDRPQLYAEDGQDWFGDAYNHGWFTPLSWTHAGYLQIFSRLIGDAGLLVPLLRVPLLFAGIAVVVQVIPAAFFASRRFDHIIASRRVRLVIAAIYLAIPNSDEIVGVLTNAQWHLALIAFLVVIASPASVPWRVFDVLTLFLMGLTGPFVLALLPVAGYYLWKTKWRWTVVLLIELALLSSIQGFELATSGRGRGVGLGVTLARFAEIVGGQIVGGTFLGQSTVLRMQTFHWTAVSEILALAGLLLFAAAIWKGPIELKLLNVFAALVLGASLASPVATPAGHQWAVLAFNANSRYWFFPTLALIIDAVFLATRSSVRLLTGIGVALLLILCVGGIREDWSIPTQPNFHWAAQVSAFAQLRPGEAQTFEETPPGWTFVLGNFARVIQSTPELLRPLDGSTAAGTTLLDAAIPSPDTIAISRKGNSYRYSAPLLLNPPTKKVEFVIFGGSFGSRGSVLCAGTDTHYGWECEWNSSSVPNGSYTLRAEVFNSLGSVYSSVLDFTVDNQRPGT